MAVSLAQYSRAVQSRPRSSTVPSSMPPYNPSEVVPMPMPEHFTAQLAPQPQHYRHSYTSAPTQWQPQRQQQQQQSPYKLQHSPIYYASPAELEASQEFGPPQPQSSRLTSSTLGPYSRASSDSTSTSTSSTPSNPTSIEPDPLPPHSNPQSLTLTQSTAFTSSAPIAALHIGVDEIRRTSTGQADFRIHRSASRVPAFMSSKPVITVTKVSSACTVGVIKFHTLLPGSRIDVSVNGRETAIAHSGVVHNRWGFVPTSTCMNSSARNAGEREKWYWKRDRSTGGAMLCDSKWTGNVLARMKGDSLTFEKPRLSVESYDEIVVSAVAMAEAARRNKRKGDVVDIGSAVGDFTSHDGGSENAGGDRMV